MVKVASFKGITYNKKKIENLDDVMAPPYDIISPEKQEELYKKHPKNFVRLTLGKEKEQDNKQNNRYTRAKDFLKSWLKEKTLIQSDKPSIYPYKVEYDLEGKSKTMNGFFVLLKLDKNYEKVKAHERTLKGPKKDRLNLMRACKANPEPIQLLYIDKDDTIRKKIDESLKKQPLVDVEGYDGFKHKLWKIDNEEIIDFVEEELEDEILFIADGHHRYQTSINFSEEMEEKTGKNTGEEPYNYRLVILANMLDEGLSILPTHRLIKKSDVEIDDLIKKASSFFKIEKIDLKEGKDVSDLSEEIKENISTENEHKFAIYLEDKYYILTLKNEAIMDKFAPNHSETWRTLDVSILHKIFLEEFVGVNEDNIERHVKYTRDDDEAIKLVDEGKFDFSIVMNPTKIDELRAVAEAGEHMPQKSTYFLPKMLSGLVMYKM
ncbi:MAG: DUF1015 domain-containing protein [Candidatus Thermoplasmatota archaeon]